MNYQIKSTIIKMEEPWHIPRASLGSISSTEKTSNKSNNNSNHSSRRGTTASGISYLNYYENNNHYNKGLYNRGYNSEDTDHSIQTISEKNLRKSKTLDTRRTIKTRDNTNDDLAGNFDKYSLKRRQQQQQQQQQQRDKKQPINNNINNNKRDINNNTEKIHKRGSRSSQGSTDSNHSSHSASSGSLLLTAANLEHFARIQHHNSLQNDILISNNSGSGGGDTGVNSNNHYNANIIEHINNKNDVTMTRETETSPSTTIDITNNNKNSFNYNNYKRNNDVDTLSIASSTHFTVVNGIGGPQRVYKSGICSRGHQITVLILSMSMIFLIGIAGAVFLLEMRAREMQQ